MKKNNRLYLFLVFRILLSFSIVAFLSSVCIRCVVAESEGESLSSSIVFVIDVSTSMHDIIGDLKSALKEYVSESKPGQSIAIVTFGTNAKLLYRRVIDEPSDVEKILKFCDGLCCDEEYTYIPAGLRRGIEELYQFYRDNPAGSHNLVLMSDGKNHPPKDIREDDLLTYEAIKEEFFSKIEPGKDLYISYVALKGMPDKELKDFVEQCRGYMTELHAEESGNLKTAIHICEAEIQPALGIQAFKDNTLDLGSAVAPASIRIPLIVKPTRGNVAGKRLKVNPIITNGASRARLAATVIPNEIECANIPMKIEIALSILGAWDEDIRGALLFQPLERSIFIVHPSQLQFLIAKPLKLQVCEEAPSVDKAECDPIERIAVGPLQLGGECFKEFVLELEGRLPSEEIEIQAIPTIMLPEGVKCTTKIGERGIYDRFTSIIVAVSALEDASLEEGMNFLGDLLILASTSSALLSEEKLSLEVFTPSPEIIQTNWKLIGWIIAVSVLLIMILGITGMVYKKKFVPHEGWLVILEEPKTDRNIPNIDLGNLSRELQKSSIIIGSEPSSDIHIPHASVGKSHTQIRSGRKVTPTPIYIKGLGVNEIKINNYGINEEIMLQDGDIVDIGDYQFLYSNSYMKQVVVHYKDGDVKYGVPLSWNIYDDGFMLQPVGEDAAKLLVHIPFRDLKGVFFVKAFDKEIAKKIKQSSVYRHKDHIVVKFKDGEIIEGYTVRHYDGKTPRFFMVPKVEPQKEENNICILVERRFTKGIKVLERVG